MNSAQKTKKKISEYQIEDLKGIFNDFIKRTSLIKCTKRGIEKIGQMAINLANYEGLHAHALSVSKRIKNY